MQDESRSKAEEVLHVLGLKDRLHHYGDGSGCAESWTGADLAGI